MSGRVVTWISSLRAPGKTLRIARTTSDGKDSEITFLTDSEHNDYKPVINPAGTRVAFFRTWQQGKDFFDWKSAIFSMKIDGSDQRKLTGHEFMNTEPYWTRDGADRITWSRMVHPDLGKRGTYVYWTKWDAKPGDEQCLSETNREWSNASLRDGRIFVKRAEEGYFFMTPDPGGKPRYDLIAYPDKFHYLHKGSISNDETMIAYMKHVDRSHDSYRGAQIVYARLFPSVPSIRDEVAFVPLDPSTHSWYVTISPDNRYLMYAEDGKIMEYDVATGERRQLSTRADHEYRYPTYVGVCK